MILNGYVADVFAKAVMDSALDIIKDKDWDPPIKVFGLDGSLDFVIYQSMSELFTAIESGVRPKIDRKRLMDALEERVSKEEKE